jgi:hypothetical protein
MPEGDQDQGRIAVTIPTILGGLDHPLDLFRRQVLAGPQLSIRRSGRAWSNAD